MGSRAEYVGCHEAVPVASARWAPAQNILAVVRQCLWLRRDGLLYGILWFSMTTNHTPITTITQPHNRTTTRPHEHTTTQPHNFTAPACNHTTTQPQPDNNPPTRNHNHNYTRMQSHTHNHPQHTTTQPHDHTTTPPHNHTPIFPIHTHTHATRTQPPNHIPPIYTPSQPQSPYS